MTDQDKFFHEHWLEIEPERLARYEQMFVFRPQQEAIIGPLELEAGHVVADFGCGPGFLAEEFARRVGASGRVFGLDINTQFLERARQRLAGNSTSADGASADGASAESATLEFHEIRDGRVDLADTTLDRLFCKNVLEYVPDLEATLSEQFRLLKSGGAITVVDSDWGFVIVEPWGEQVTRDFFRAAAPAFREPHIGRRLYGALKQTGFQDVRVQISSTVDTQGGAMAVIRNMASYIRRFDAMPEAGVEDLLDSLNVAVAEGTFMFVLPQFVVTGRKP